MRTLPSPFALALALVLATGAGCKSKPHREPFDLGLAAEQASLAARAVYYDLLVEYPAKTLREAVEAENLLESSSRKRLKGPLKEARKLADQALDVDPQDVRVQLAMAEILYLEAICRGSTRSIFAGLRAKVRKYYRKAIELDPDYGGGGAYRVKAKYLIRAPWPKRDPEWSERAAWAAADSAPSAENLLVLGDVQYLRGKRLEAARTWLAASKPRQGDTAMSLDARELANRRFQLALEQGVQPTLR